MKFLKLITATANIFLKWFQAVKNIMMRQKWGNRLITVNYIKKFTQSTHVDIYYKLTNLNK